MAAVFFLSGHVIDVLNIWVCLWFGSLCPGMSWNHGINVGSHHGFYEIVGKDEQSC